VGGEQRLGDERKSHREAGSQSGPRQSGGGAAKFLFTFAANSFVDDLGANGDALFHLFFFDASGDGATVGGKSVAERLF
jgi:hypothetical protein